MYRYLVIAILAVSLTACASLQDKLFSNRFQNRHRNISYSKPVADVSNTTAFLDSAPELTEKGHEKLGDMALNRGDLYSAFVHYEEALAKDPDNIQVKYKKGFVNFLGGHGNDAKKIFQEIIEAQPDYALAHEGLGQIYFDMKQYEQAEQYFCKAVSLDSKLWKSHNFLGIIYDYENQHEKAIRAYETALSLAPDKGDLYNNLGMSYCLTGKYEKAVAAFNKALATGSFQKKTYNNMALALAKLERYPEAFEAFRKAGDEAQAYNNLGCVYAWKNDFENARICFEKAIELKPRLYERAHENLKKCRFNQLQNATFSQTGDTVSDYNRQTKHVLAEQKTKQNEQMRTYTVKHGDNLWGIAKQFNVAHHEIITINKLASRELSSGQVLLIPDDSQ